MRSVPLTRRQLGATRGRTAAGIVGIAVGILLILALQGIFGRHGSAADGVRRCH